MTAIDDEACEWILTLEASRPSGRSYEKLRHRMFCAWLARSPAHVRALLELHEAYLILQDIDPAGLRTNLQLEDT